VSKLSTVRGLSQTGGRTGDGGTLARKKKHLKNYKHDIKLQGNFDIIEYFGQFIFRKK
jgi:hypothetical protein